MLLLTSTSDKVQVVTDSTANVDVHASYMDYDGDAVTPGRKNTAISSSTTTDVVSAPGSGVVRNVKYIQIRNKHASTSVTVTIKHTDGTTGVELHKRVVVAGDQVFYADTEGFSGGSISGITSLAVADGGTGASTAAGARSSLDLAQSSDIDGRYRTILRTAGKMRASDITASGDYLLATSGAAAAAATAGTNWFPIELYAADHALTGRSTKLRIVADIGVNDTAPGVTIKLGLYPVGNPSGIVAVWNPNVSAVIAASVITFTTPGADAWQGNQNSGDFTFPSDGRYILGVNVNGAMAANSYVEIPLRLEVRNV